MLLDLNHPYIVHYLAVGVLPFGPNGLPCPQTAVLMEYCDGGTLNELCTTRKLTEGEILEFLQQIVAAVRYLHERPLPIFHGDIKGDNIFLTMDQVTCKLGDMENFHLLVEGKTNVGGLKVKEGTILHMSPEMLTYAFSADDDEDVARSTGIGRASDVWSIGCTVLEMIGEGNIQFTTADKTIVSFESGKINKFIKQVKSGATPDQSTAATRLSPKFGAIVANCLLRTPAHRPTARELEAALAGPLAGSRT
ncbi:putative Mitogen-activated protein kinase kinase kinase 4 [Hypsibius exemplaris]|uniref:Mitogen-activated protein kinase kinase kinase 4 n=1 Tax=Hypsibius exemplaris TaxID=2072580 RepID=A0A1W0WBH5_HYPEX|nr:putative Mitogen-activated protein kinase kinase kinase 4 [Hypsibius exemplaris]